LNPGPPVAAAGGSATTRVGGAVAGDTAPTNPSPSLGAARSDLSSATSSLAGAGGAISAADPTAAEAQEGSLPASASVSALAAVARCGSFPDLVRAVHAQVARREQTLTNLATVVRARPDPFGMNAAQLAVLQGAQTSVTALDTSIPSGCYETRAALIESAAPLFAGQRVYWLRVPQTQVIVACDYLADAQSRLTDAATKLATVAGSDANARADIAAMQTALATASAKLGIPPTADPSLRSVTTLHPAADMSRNDATIENARVNLTTARAALDTARAAGERAIALLRA
jgi:hypothetical protein